MRDVLSVYCLGGGSGTELSIKYCVVLEGDLSYSVSSQGTAIDVGKCTALSTLHLSLQVILIMDV